jgi:hypothetical protein
MAEELWWVEHISIDRKGQKVPTFCKKRKGLYPELKELTIFRAAEPCKYKCESVHSLSRVTSEFTTRCWPHRKQLSEMLFVSRTDQLEENDDNIKQFVQTVSKYMRLIMNCSSVLFNCMTQRNVRKSKGLRTSELILTQNSWQHTNRTCA